MKRLYLIYLFILTAISVHGQKMPQDYYEEGVRSFFAKDYETTISDCRYIVANYPYWQNYRDAYALLSQGYLKAGFYDSALSFFKWQLTDTGRLYKRYQHESAILIYEAYKVWGKYDSALYYLYQADTVYPYYNGCGNAIEDEMFRSTERFAELYKVQGDTLQAAKMYLHYVLWHPDYVKGAERIISLLERYIDIPTLQKEFAASVKMPLHADHARFGLSYITFLGTKMYLHFGDPGPYSDNAKRIALLKSSAFYKLLMASGDKPVKTIHQKRK